MLADRPQKSYNRWLALLVVLFLITTIVFIALYAVEKGKVGTTTTATTTPAGPTTTISTGPTTTTATGSTTTATGSTTTPAGSSFHHPELYEFVFILQLKIYA